ETRMCAGGDGARPGRRPGRGGREPLGGRPPGRAQGGGRLPRDGRRDPRPGHPPGDRPLPDAQGDRGGRRRRPANAPRARAPRAPADRLAAAAQRDAGLG
ncbi:MAG: hypothetical protein AVDCRST_MAG30-218, partial [uncultured Solirubrobacteraceae bacterium]